MNLHTQTLYSQGYTIDNTPVHTIHTDTTYSGTYRGVTSTKGRMHAEQLALGFEEKMLSLSRKDESQEAPYFVAIANHLPSEERSL